MHALSAKRLVFGLLLALAVSAAAAHGASRACAGEGIRVEGASSRDREAACEAVARAAAFFAAVGLRTPSGVVIRLVADRSSALPEAEIGHYDAGRNEILIRDYRSYQATPPPPGDDPAQQALRSVPFWQGWIVHELTHAAVHATCGSACLSHALHEYVAAVAQFATLDRAVRARFLAEYGDIGGFDELSQVSDIYYAFNPRYFIVKAYKHFRSQPDSRRFLRDFVSSLARN